MMKMVFLTAVMVEGLPHKFHPIKTAINYVGMIKVAFMFAEDLGAFTVQMEKTKKTVKSVGTLEAMLTTMKMVEDFKKIYYILACNNVEMI